MPTLNQSWVAGASILPSVIVRQDTASPRQILVATLGHQPVGVTHEGTIYAPIPDVATQYAAYIGNSCRVYGPGEECEVNVSATLAIAAGDMVAPDASSLAQPAVHGFPILGYALDASAAAGKVRVRIVDNEICNRRNTVLVKTADYTLALADLGKTITNTGDGDTLTIALPVAVVGYEFSVRLSAAQEIRLDPNVNETISAGSGVPGTAGQYATANAIGETATFRCEIAGHWSIVEQSGTWTVA
jgi:hypothetical protein